MDFSETIVVYDINVDRWSQLKQYMKLDEYQRSRSVIDLGPSHSDLIFSKFFSSITAEPIEAKFHVKPPLGRQTKVYSNGLGHMIKMAAISIYGKNLHLWNRKASDLESLYAAFGTRVIPSLLKWWHWGNLDLFYCTVQFGPLCFIWGKV